MKINNLGLKLIKDFEGLRLTAYQDSVGVWTIGYGSTLNINRGMVISEKEAEQRLLEDLRIAESDVNRLVKVSLTSNQFSALVSFVFNLGGSAFADSTLLRLLNAGKYKEAADQLLRWNKAGKTELEGLTRRRKAERELFLLN